MKPEELVDEQLVHYNSKNLERFLSFYSENIELFAMGEVVPYASGLENMRPIYRKRFENRNLMATIENRITKNDFVIDHESISGIEESPIHVIAIYKIENRKIRTVWFIRDK